MRIIGVIDVRQGKAVHAVAGQRSQYSPHRGVAGEPLRAPSLAHHYVHACGVADVYLADLDAIEKRDANWKQISQVAQIVPRLWLDVGIHSPAGITEVARLAEQFPTLQPVVALESLASVAMLHTIAEQWGRRQLVFSLDLRHGRPVTAIEAWKNDSAMELAQRVAQLGIQKLLVLDLAQVGTQKGCSTMRLCGQLRNDPVNGAHWELYTGGGIRNQQDVDQLQQVGCDGVLMATALLSQCPFVGRNRVD